MANVFSGNPYDAQIAAMGAAPRKPTQDPRAVIDGLATRYQVPANVLLALDEAAGGTGQQAEAFAREIADGIKAGKSVDAILAEKAGDPTRAAALMNRAYDIADEMYPAPAAPPKQADGSVVGDLGRQLGGSVVKAGGAMVEGVGQGVDAAANAAGSVINPVYQALTGEDIGQTTMGRDAGVAAGDSVRAVGDNIQSGISPEGRQALMDSTPDGDIMKPLTYSLGKNPSLRGYAMLGADVLGSLLPVVATAVITKSPVAAAAVGGSMGGGSGAETARDIVQGMANEVGPDGKSKLEAESALYRELVAGGASPEQAVDRVTREAERLAFLFTTPISAFGGAATAKIIQRGATEVGKRGLAGRVAGTAALSGLEEGVQEAAESMAARFGTGQGAQMPIDITEGTFGDFILGALGGAPVGAVAGLASGRSPADQPPPAEQAPAPLALPAPNNGGTIFADGPVGAPPRDFTNFERDPAAQRETLSDGSGQGQAAPPLSSPVPPPPGADGAAAPLGPISQIAAAAPDLTPVPEVEPVEVPPMFSEMKPGTAVRLQDPDGAVIDAVFQREEDGTAVVRIGGQEVALDPGAFDTAVQGARQADLEAEAKAKGQKVPKTKAPAKPKPGKLSEQAVAAVTPPAPEPDITPEQAAKAAKVIEDKAAKEGWTKGLRKKHDNLITLAGEAYSPKPAATSDVPDGVAGNSSLAPGETVDPETGEVTQASAGTGRTDPPVVATSGTPDNGMDGATDAGERGVALTPAPRAPVAPITTPPDDRIQPDMLGGADTNETAMATKERRRKEWGRVLGIAANGSRSDETLEGREMLIRPSKIVIRAKNGEKSDLDFTIDTEGMDKEAIATAIRGGLQALDRVSPVAAPEPAPAPAAPAKPATAETDAGRAMRQAADDMGSPTDKADQIVQSTLRDWAKDADSRPGTAPWATLTTVASRLAPRYPEIAKRVEAVAKQIEGAEKAKPADPAKAKARASVEGYKGVEVDNIREKAAVLRGLPKDRPPQVPGVSLKWDEKEGGFIFSRKHADKVLQAAYVEEDAIAAEAGAVPTPAEIKAEADKADKNPTDAQKEAGNYKMGHINWNGLDISIETAKGAMRRGKSATGKEWSVKLSAHYGYIKRTEGADGDHLDVYMGDKPDSDAVYVFDQYDPKTKRFDEHKTVLGVSSLNDAVAIYDAGFSDGSGPTRRKAPVSLTVDQFKAWLATGDLSKPASRLTTDDVAPAPKAKPGPKSLGMNARGRPLFEDENGVRSYSDNGVTATEAVSMTPTRDRGYVMGVNKSDRGKDFLTQEEWDAENKEPEPAPANAEGIPGVLVIKSLQTGKTSTVDTRPSQPAPAPKPGLLSSLSQEKQDRAAELKARLAAKARSQTSSGLDPEYITLGGELVALYIEAGTKKFGQMLRDFAETTGLSMREAQAPMRAAYNHVRDDMDLNGEDIAGMDSSDQVMAEVRKALAAEATAKPSQKPADRGNVTQETPAEEAAGDATGSDDIGSVGQDGEPQAGGVGNVTAGEPDGNGTDQPLGAPEAGSSVGDEAIRGGSASRPRSGRKVRGSDDGTDPAGDAPVRRPRAGAGGLVDAGRGRDEPTVPGRANYRITDPEALFAGGPKARFKKNREALETFQRVSDESRDPTPEEMDAMAAYIGWGSFGQELFQGTFEYRGAVKPEWKDEDSWLRDTLGKEAWLSAQNSIINAHYTDPPTVKAIWAAIEAMGFKGGRVLEPSMGIGNFFGLMPQHLEKASHLTGIELDKTTGGMAKILYPRANVRIMGYEKSTTPDSFYDLVIGNWPFANFSPADRRYNDLNASLHDYFFVKAVDQVRPGGLVVGITSAFSMDGTKNRNVRLHLAKRAELVASFRLPSGAFEKYAGTKVVTDLVIYRKRDAMIMDTTQETWIKSAPFKTPSGDEINVNQYYIDNPGQVLGTLDYGSGTTYFKSGMIVRRPDNIGELLEGIAKRVPADAYRKPERRGKETRFVANNTSDRRFSVTVGADGALYQVLGDQMAALEDVVKYRTSNATETKAREDQFRKLVDMRRKVGAVMDADRDGAADADAKRAELRTAYQAFRKAHGPINDSYAIGLMLKKLKDPLSGLLMALENTDGTPAAIMDKSTVRAARKLDNPTIRDAFVMSRNETLALDIERIADLAKTSVDAVTGDLIEAKAIYRVPGGGYQPSDVYLAGNVRQKLVEARDAAAQGEDMAASITALEAVQPPDIPYFQIEARFGADWLAPDVNRQFVIETLGIEYTNPDDVKLIRSVSGWRVELSDRVARMRGVSDITGAPTPGKSGTGLSLRRFLEATLNTQSLSVTESDGDGGTVKDTKATDQANAKAGELREKFGEWVWKDPERRFEVERSYNEIMNAVATPQIDGSFMEFPGMALTRGTSPFNLRKHQSDAIWKGILNQRGIYGHEVGTGKTITMAGIAVESRRYGLAKKPLLIAHNANSSAVATEAQETYPGAKIMYVDNLSPSEIEAQLGRMRTEDWDLIVIPHSLIDRMSLSEDTLMQMAADDIAAYEAEAIAAAQEEGIELSVEDMDGNAKDLTKKLFSSATAKEMVKARNRLIESIRKQAMRASREGAVAFEDLGIDMILVDESHEFKKPPIATRMAVKGLNKGTSDRSLALRFLTNYVKGQRGGTGVHVFTGTPLTNTLTEIYHQMYYAMDDVMRVNKVDTWDGFFKAFANTISDVEVTATNEYENVERLAAFINVSELRRMAGQYMDIVFADDMPEFKPRTTASGKDMNSKDLTDKERAELLDGRNDDPQGRPYKKVVHDIGPMGADQKRILQETVGYARAFKAASGKTRREIMQRGGPDAPIVFNGVPNRASMDPRLHEMDAEDDPNSKANRAVKNIARIYNEEPMATQVLFMDEGYSDASVSVKTNKETGEKTKTKKAKFNLVADIVAKLVKQGVKPEEIFIVAGGVTADQKRIIADKMNKREIRVVIGQTRTLGVGVNMQKYLRAMHHLDAPWMPGDLEQRNGRGQRQGNTWNTVYEYRYLTESLDGRRWQVLAIKDRFIKAFLKAKEGLRTIEGDAADDSESMDSSSLGDTLAEAAGDPRLMQSNKLAKRIEKLQSRERIHSQGIADAISKAKRLRATAEREEAELPPRRDDAAHVKGLRESAAFSATVNGKTYDNRPEAEAAIEAYLPKAGLQIRRGTTEKLAVEVNGFTVEGQVMQYASVGNTDFRIIRAGTYNIGKPSLSSIEGAIRRIPDRLADAEATIADTRKQAERLDAMAKEPFQQQKDLDQKKADLEKLKQDMQDNPVPAPVWLRQSAPIDTLIFVDGQERVVTGHRWTETGWFVATEQGDVDYAEAKDQFGMPLYDVVPFEAPEVLEGSKAIMGDEAEGDGAEMREDAMPVATLTGNELGPWEDIRQLGKKAEAWYRNNLVGSTVVMESTGWEIQFGRVSSKKLGGRKGDILLRMVPALDKLIARSELVSTTPGAKPGTEQQTFHKVSARVEIDGVMHDVIATLREDANGKFHYDISMDQGAETGNKEATDRVAEARGRTDADPGKTNMDDGATKNKDMSDGARFMRLDGNSAAVRMGETQVRSPALEGNPVDLNLEFAPSESKADPAITEDAIRALTRDMNAELAASGLAGKVSVRVVRRLISNVSGDPIQGRFNDGAASIEVRAGSAAGERGVMRHEIIHALRSEALWNRPGGLFTPAEWRELSRAAQAEPEIVASVKARYPNLDRPAQVEEMVAELYRLWADQRDGYQGVAKALAKVEAFLQAMANLLRGKGFVSAALTMDQIAGGKVGGRGPQGPGGGWRGQAAAQDGAEMRAIPGTVRDKFKGLVGFRNWRDPKEVLRNITTDAMTGDKMSVLALVPGRALFAEMGSKMLSTKRYIRAKEEMDTLRNDWHAKAADVAQKWIDMQKKDLAANAAMMDLMHRSTMTGVDPSKPDTWGKDDQFLHNAKMEVSRSGDKAPDWAKQKLADLASRQKSYAAIKAIYDALPESHQAFYVEVKDSYEQMADEFDQALEDNIKAGAKIALKRAEKEHRKTLRQIEDDGLTGDEKAKALEDAEATLAKVRARANSGAASQIKTMRKVFEGQRLKGPYFPLARFGDYFVTVRDEDGKVINFSRFESEQRQQVFKAEQEQAHPGRVSFGLMSKKGDMRDQVDPKFVSDVEMLLADSGASAEVMDAIWQRYLETMPDQSIRTSKIHRKGREGFNRDALRSYTSHTFHGAHQLARLKYGLELQDSLDDAEDEARRADDPNRATALVNEMRKRMDWTMNPTGSTWSAAASSLAFVWYLGVSPAAALVNLTQTTVIGPAVMKAGLKNATIGKILTEMGRAAKDFGKGQGVSWKDTWTAENAPGLTDDERAAMKEGYRRGTIDKTQAHDLASVAESGVEFSPFREKWMRRIGFAFHHAERVNREVTFLAAYRLARQDGLNHADAIEKGSDLTWKTHFSYQNSDRPRFMQSDIFKVLFIFRQFSVNLLYRLFRDAHQSLQGATKAERKEARTQLVGISLSMMAHAGIKGVWGYSLLMSLMALFLPGDSDDLEEWMQDALLMEGDSLGVAAANYAMGAFLNGVPGQLTGAALTERIGSPNLWFRGSDRNLEGEAVVQHYINELAGPIGGIAYSIFGRGIPALAEGEVVRGVEALTPKFVRDVVRTGRYATEGVTTRNGDDLIEDVNPWELILQANGFTPARVAERYDINTRLKNKEREITDQRKDLHRAASDAIKAGDPIPEKVMDQIRAFNIDFPEYPITAKTIKQSYMGRMRASERNEFGVSLNPKLNDRLRGDLAPALWN